MFLEELGSSRRGGKNTVDKKEHVTLNGGMNLKARTYRRNKGWKRLVQER